MELTLGYFYVDYKKLLDNNYHTYRTKSDRNCEKRSRFSVRARARYTSLGSLNKQGFLWEASFGLLHYANEGTTILCTLIPMDTRYILEDLNLPNTNVGATNLQEFLILISEHKSHSWVLF